MFGIEGLEPGTVFTVGGGALVAMIGGAYALRARRTPGPPEAPSVRDAWAENRALGGEIRLLRDAFDALYAWVQRALQTWGMGTPPEFSDDERDAITKVRNVPRFPEHTGGEFLP